jgi:hypothetical protein
LKAGYKKKDKKYEKIEEERVIRSCEKVKKKDKKD